MNEEDTEGYKVIGWTYLIFAFTLLLYAYTFRGIESLREARLVLIIIGGILTVLGGFMCFQKGGKEKRKKNLC